MIKLRILLTMAVFKDDIDNGKKIWLTETACIHKSDTNLCNNNNNKSTGVIENTKYVNDLFWYSTKGNTPLIKSCAQNIIDSLNELNVTDINTDTYLSGLRTTTEFTFNNVSASWYDHGFEAVTFFSACIPAWKENCYQQGITTDMQCDSRIFDKDAKLNNIWHALKSPPK